MTNSIKPAFLVFEISYRTKMHLNFLEDGLSIKTPKLFPRPLSDLRDSDFFYGWNEIADVSVQHKKKWLGEDIILNVTTMKGKNRFLATYLFVKDGFFSFKVKDESTAKEIITAIRLYRVEYEKTTRYWAEQQKIHDENIKQKAVREEEIQHLLISRYKSGNFDNVHPRDFEEIIGKLFRSMGYLVKNTGKTGDEGIDLICTNHSNSEITVVQCKRYKGVIGAPIVRDFYGALIHYKAKKGYIVTTSYFTKSAIEWIKDKPIVFINKQDLANLMTKYYV